MAAKNRSEIIEELRQFDMPSYGSDREISERLRIAETVCRMGDAIPDWLESTPVTIFRLIVEDPGRSWVQDICLSYDEFESLKLHLAELRGYKLTETKEAPAEEEPAKEELPQKRVETELAYFGFDLSDHAGVEVDYCELLLKDADGDLITSIKETEEFGGCPVNVIIDDKTNKETAVRLLRKITDVIEKNGICHDEYAVHTKNPVIDQIEVLRAKVVASGGRVTGGEAVTPPE